MTKDQSIIVCLSGRGDKDVHTISNYLAGKDVKKMYVFGETKDQLKAIYPEAVVLETMEEALNLAHQEAIAGDIVLLSPMCASWDQFKNFEERGDIFVSIVESF